VIRKSNLFVLFGLFILGCLAETSHSGGLKRGNSDSAEDAKTTKVGEHPTNQVDPGNPRGDSLLPHASKPLPKSLADEVEDTLGGNRGPGYPGIVANVPRLKPTGIKNEFRVVEDPSGQFSTGDIVTCDENGICTKH